MKNNARKNVPSILAKANSAHLEKRLAQSRSGKRTRYVVANERRTVCAICEDADAARWMAGHLGESHRAYVISAEMPEVGLDVLGLTIASFLSL